MGVVLCAAAFVAAASVAMPEMQAPPDTGAPGEGAAAAPTRVGRISLVAGKVQFRAADETAWSDAGINYPIATGEALRTDPNAHAEIQVGPDSIAIAGGSELTIAELSDRTVEIALPQGRIALHVRLLGADQSLAVDIPRGGAWLLQPGRYDIAAGSAGEAARIAVLAGAARFAGGGADIAIAAGERAVLDGTGAVTASPEAAVPDAFANWAQTQDYDASRLAAPYYVSPQTTGYAVLDEHGSWQITAEYGAAWFPDDLPDGWVPYRVGHWRWMAPWGWTWIDDQPWGFAPFHYGRWARIDGRWGWVPGAFVAHPAYAPALVDFLGTPAVGISFAEGSGPAIGWFPLAPGEIYWPYYSGDLAFIRRLNAAAVADPDTIDFDANGRQPLESVTGHFANREFATVVPRPVFIKDQPVAAAHLQLPEERLLNVPVLFGAPQIGPPKPVTAAAQRPAAPRVAAVAVVRPERGANNRVPAVAHPPHPLPVRLAVLRGGHAAAPPSPHHPPTVLAHATHEPAHAEKHPVRR
jgi:hypothetical protein